MTIRSATVIGVFILAAALSHAVITSTLRRPGQKPLHVGHVSGEIVYRIEPASTGRYKADGCKVECYESFAVVYLDRAKEPTWTGNYVLMIPWQRIESMMLQPEG
jgi:hypothetical protein